MKNPKSILITGGSSGIGEALLFHYARPGVTLAFNGRNRERIGRVAEKCRSIGATVYEEVLDVTDQSGMEAWIKKSTIFHRWIWFSQTQGSERRSSRDSHWING